MAALRRLGLTTGKKHIPLRSLSADVTIRGFVARVESTYVYFNDTDSHLPVGFVFPMDDNSAVYHFEADINGRMVVAECQDKEEARMTYRDAMDSNMSSLLLEEHASAGDMFQCRLGQLASKPARIKISYVTELTPEPDGALKFALPTVLNPRYNANTSAARIPCASRNRYKMTLKASVVSDDEITILPDRTGMKINVTSWDKAEVVYNGFPTFDNDVGFTISHGAVPTPRAVIERGIEDPDPGSFFCKDVVMLTFYPNLKDNLLMEENEFIFVIDRSESMKGERMECAKMALSCFLRSLPLGCLFNVVSFGSRHESLFNTGSELLSKETLERAGEFQKAMTADFGNTETLHTLQHVFNQPITPGIHRQIFLLTDGGDCGKESVVSLVQKNSDHSRVFAIGIGAGASTALIRNVAKAGKGCAEFVTGKEDNLDLKVAALVKKSLKPLVTDVKVDLDLPTGVRASLQIPSEVPVIYSEDRCVLYVFTDGKPLQEDNTTGRARIRWNICTDMFEQDLDIDFGNSQSDTGDMIHRLAMKSVIKDLEMSESRDGAGTKRREIVMASKVANIISKYTSFVGVDKKTNETISSPGQQPAPKPKPVYGCGRRIRRRRRRVILRDRPLSVPSGNFRRLERRAGVKRTSGLLPWESRAVTKVFLEEVLRNSICHTEHSYRNTLTTSDVLNGLRNMGHTIWVDWDKWSKVPCPSLLKYQTCLMYCTSNVFHQWARPSIGDCETSQTRPRHDKEKTKSKPVSPGGGGADVSRKRKLKCRQHLKDQQTSGKKSLDPEESSSDIDVVTSIQRSDGSWFLSSKLAKVLGTSSVRLKRSSPVSHHNVWATALAVAWLTFKCRQMNVELKAMVKKAKEWLKHQNPSRKEVAGLMRDARTFVS